MTVIINYSNPFSNPRVVSAIARYEDTKVSDCLWNFNVAN